MIESILYKTAIYCRLSLDDGSLGESGSIQTQKMMLEKHCRDNNFTIKEVYIGNTLDIYYLGHHRIWRRNGLFVVSNSAIELINWGLTIYKGSLYFDNDERHSIYNASLNLSVYAGFNFEKNKYGVELGGSVGRLGYDGRFIDVQVDFLTAKFFFIYEDGKIKIDPGFGWVDFRISIDIAAIIEYLKGNGWCLWLILMKLI